MRMRQLGSALALSAMLGSTTVGAHHDASYDADQGQRIRWHGTVRQVSWDGAHVMYRIDVANAAGHIESWRVLGASPKGLARRGIRQATIAMGTEVTLEGYLNPYNSIVSPIYIEAGTERHYVGYFDADGEFFDAFKRRARTR